MASPRNKAKAAAPKVASKPAKRVFNPLAAFGTVTPPERGAVFYQDGGYFNASHDLVFEDYPATPPEVVETEVTVVDAETGTIKTEIVQTEAPVVNDGDPKVILAGWLKGETKLPFLTVRGLVKSGFNQVLVTKDEIISYLVNEANLVPAEQVKVAN